MAHSGPHAYPYISLGFDPAWAWALSGGLEHAQKVELWDLWQVWVPDNVPFEVRPEYGAKVQEVKVHGSIPSDKLFYVGTRGLAYAELLDGAVEPGS